MYVQRNTTAERAPSVKIRKKLTTRHLKGSEHGAVKSTELKQGIQERGERELCEKP